LETVDFEKKPDIQRYKMWIRRRKRFVAVNFLGPECLIVPAIEVGGFCIENSK
jgi:hypothetical protein